MHTSTHLEIHHVPAVFQNLAVLVDRRSAQRLAQIANQINETQTGDDQHFDLRLTFLGLKIPLQIHVRATEVPPRITFSGPSELIAAIDAGLDGLLG